MQEMSPVTDTSKKPWKGIYLLVITEKEGDEPSYGTAFAVQLDYMKQPVLLTAAHNIRINRGGGLTSLPHSVKVHSLSDNSSFDLNYNQNTMRYSDAWDGATFAHDYAMLWLPPSAILDTIDIAPVSPHTCPDTITLAGFPVNNPAQQTTLYEGSTSNADFGSDEISIEFDINGSGGVSGGPVMVGSGGQSQAIAIYRGGGGSGGKKRARLLDDTVLNDIKKWYNEGVVNAVNYTTKQGYSGRLYYEEFFLGEDMWIKRNMGHNRFQWDGPTNIKQLTKTHYERIDATYCDFADEDKHYHFSGNTYLVNLVGRPQRSSKKFGNEPARPYDAICQMRDQSVVIFKGDQYWVKTSDTDMDPEPISSKWGRTKDNPDWPDLITPISAAYTVDGYDTVHFFHGTQMWIAKKGGEHITYYTDDISSTSLQKMPRPE